MLSSVSTLIHDTYLPLFMSEVLQLSNARVSVPGKRAKGERGSTSEDSTHDMARSPC